MLGCCGNVGRRPPEGPKLLERLRAEYRTLDTGVGPLPATGPELLLPGALRTTQSRDSRVDGNNKVGDACAAVIPPVNSSSCF